MTTYPDDADGAVLQELESHGVDMTQPLTIEFAIAAPDESSANSIAIALSATGYEPEIAYDEGEPDEDGEIDPEDEEEFGPSWSVYVSIEMVPTYDDIVRIQEELDALAQQHGGNADGWGAMLG